MSKEFCGTYPAGLVAYFKLNEGTPSATNTGATTVTEYVAGNDGLLNNFALNGVTSNWVIGAVLNGGNTTSIISESSCAPYVSPSGKIFSASGTYSDTIPNSSGCDSIIELDSGLLLSS